MKTPADTKRRQTQTLSEDHPHPLFPLTRAHWTGDALATEVAPESQQRLQVGVPAEKEGRVCGRPQEAAAPDRYEQNQEENTWVRRKNNTKQKAERRVRWRR